MTIETVAIDDVAASQAAAASAISWKPSLGDLEGIAEVAVAGMGPAWTAGRLGISQTMLAAFVERLAKGRKAEAEVLAAELETLRSRARERRGQESLDFRQQAKASRVLPEGVPSKSGVTRQRVI